MDGSAFKHLPAGKIIVFAIIGWIATIGACVGALLWIVWWVIHHIQIV